ncbi:MAG: hypothetical protein CBC13_04840 [Planctomycetia bacterium TMED53]|nr:MAG: hypothetical protein CBC13_04840 [Planctomycetia bacterium TMED53]
MTLSNFTYICADPGIPVPGQKGASIHVASICKAFRQLGLGGDLYTIRPEATELEGVPIHEMELPPRKKHKSVEERESRLFLARLDNVETVHDFVYERYSLWHPGGLYLARKHEVPFVLEVNSPLALESKKYRQLANENLASGLSRLLLRESDVVICVSKEIKEWVESERGHSEGVELVPNGVDQEVFKPSDSKRPSNLPPNDVPLIGFTGTFRPWHGIDDLLHSFEILVKELGSDAHLLCIGDGPGKHAFEVSVQNKGLSGRVHFTGSIPHSAVGSWLGHCDLGVAPYPQMDEFWFSPLKIFEYFSCGLPVVATDRGQISELIKEDRGALITPGNPAEFAKGIQKVLSRLDQQPDLGKKCRDWVLNNATWKMRAQQILKAVEAIR